MKRTGLFVKILTLFCLVMGSVTGQAAIIFDNTFREADGVQFVRPQGSGSGWWATGFSTTAEYYQLQKVTLLLSNSSNGTQFSVRVYASNIDSPNSIPTGSYLATLYSGTSNAFSSPFVLDSLATLLQPSTNYFLSVEPTSNQLGWTYTNDIQSAVASNNGTGWVGTTNFPNLMKIEATAASVPEPSQVAAMILVIFLITAFNAPRVFARFARR